MRNLSNAFRRALFNNDRTYLAFADITLTTQGYATLNLTNSEIWSGGFSNDDAVSEDDSFSALGSTIINSATLIINNMHDQYSQYNFDDAKVVLYVGKKFVDEGTGTERLEKVKLGTYNVDEPSYNGSTITLSLLDNMELFDRPYNLSNLTYPASLNEIVRDACLQCGVRLGTVTFPHSDYTVNTRPDADNITFREVIGYAAAIAGCFARCNSNGELEFKWFNYSALQEEHNNLLDGGVFDSDSPYSTGDTADGGRFNPWDTGDEWDAGEFTDSRIVHYIPASSVYSQSVSMYDTIITGVKITTRLENTDEVIEHQVGADGYIISVDDNPLINVEDIPTVARWLGTQLIGLTFRKLDISHANTPAIEAGDVAVVWDRKLTQYFILVTRTAFSVDGQQITVCGSDTISANRSDRMSSSTKAFTKARALVVKEKTARELAIENLDEKLDEHSGLYSTIEQAESGNIYYLHDMPTLNESMIVWKMTRDAWGVSTDGGQTWNGGMTVDGDAIVRILSAVGIDFDWGTGGTLTLGGRDNVNGQLKMLNAAGTQIGKWDNDGIQISSGNINLGDGNFIVDTDGELTTTSLTATDFIKVDGTWKSEINIPFTWGALIKYTVALDQYGFHMRPQTNQPAGAGKLTTAGNIYYGNVFSPGLKFTYGQSGAQHEYETQLFSERWSLYHVDSSSTSSSTVYDRTTTVEPAKFNMRQGSYVLSFDGSTGRFYCSGTKSRAVDTEDYGNRLLYCYEMPSPMFGDIGEGTLGDDGLCYVQIDPTFSETINTKQYQVFLQKYGEGDCFVESRHTTYFIIKGTPGLSFGWELKGKQYDFDQLRLEKNMDSINLQNEVNYSAMAQTHIQDINRQREVTL